MNIPNAKSAQATSAFNYKSFKEKFKTQLETKIEQEIIKHIADGDSSATIWNCDHLANFRVDYYFEVVSEICEELEEKGYTVVRDISGQVYTLKINWRK